MSNTPLRKTPAALAGLRQIAQTESGERRAAYLRLIAELEQPQPQAFEGEDHAALACPRCKYLPCHCGVPVPPTLNQIVALQQQRRGTRDS